MILNTNDKDWEDGAREGVKRLSLHRKKREVAKATPLFDERWPWATHYRPQVVDEPDCIRLVDVMNIEKACARWLANRGLQASWRRSF